MTNVKIVIPARFASSRFPGKPLINLEGKSMIQRVWETAAEAHSASNCFVATDDSRIEQHCANLGIQVINTPSDCETGTDRIAQAAEQIDGDIFINIQGDEPLLDPADIVSVIETATRNPEMILNCMAPIAEADDFRSPTVPKVVFNLQDELLYMSRAAIPATKSLEFIEGYRQVCIYAFPRSALEFILRENQRSPFEALEDIEILRFLEHGFRVKMLRVSSQSIAVDIPADADRVRSILKSRSAS